jgi:hypothetical protein
MCLAFCGGSALAATRTLAPARQRAASVEFKLKKIAPADIRSASLRIGKKRLALKLSVIRKAASKGVLKVRLPKSVRKKGQRPVVRLRIVLADKAPVPGPAGGGSPPADPLPGNGFPVLAAAGDIACDPTDVDYNGGNGTATNCRHRYTAPLLAGSDAVLALGDEAYGPTGLAAAYNPTWGAYKSITHPIPGDHEYEDVGISSYQAYFGAAAGPVGLYYYSFDVGSWHIVALNSFCSMVDCAAETTWLQADLAANTAKCTVLYWHHPHFTDGPHVPDEDGSTLPFWNAAIARNADIILHGNDHSYQRWPKMDATGATSASGIREWVVGTGGKSHTTPTGTGAQVRNGDTFGVLKLRLKPAGYDWKFIPEAGKTFTDEGSDTCS